MNKTTNKMDLGDKKRRIDIEENCPRHSPRKSVLIYFSKV